jgi:hypothetical protein
MSLRRRDLALGAAALALARPAAALAQVGDRRLLELTLEVERRLVAVYAKTDGFAQARLFGEHCREHVDGLELAYRNRAGSLPDVAAPPVDPPGRETAMKLETEAVAACYRAIGALRDGRLLPAFAAIMACHGQHLVVLREELRRDPLPAALETGGVH